jgi:hypothetical protein
MREAVTPQGRFVLFSFAQNIFGKAGLLLVAVATVAGLAFAQFTNANLSGIVSDPTGAPVAQATVTAVNTGTGLQKSVITDEGGNYLFTALPVGQYQITVEKAGFSKYVQSGITLVVGQSATAPVQLQIGNVSEQVSVSANAAMVTTETGMVAHLVDQKRIMDLPLNGRQPQTLLFLAPGTVNETGKYCLVNCQGGVYPGEQDANVGGGGPRSVNFQMDGAAHNDTYVNTNLPFPNPDAVQEFNLQSDNLSAQYGMGAGAVVNIITKSGTNSVHGDVFEFLRNGDLNARNFFAPTQDTLKRNQYGGSLGGHIIRDKLFYFGTYQGTRIRSAAQGQVAFVPTAAERAGNFSQSSIAVRDPVTGAAYAGNQIPANLLNSSSQYFLQSIPLPNGPNRQLTYAGPRLVQNDDQYMVKINWIAGKNQVTGSYFWTRFNEPPDLNVSKQNLLAADNSGNRVKVQNLALNDTFSFSPTLLFNTWFGWTSQTGGSLSGAPFGFPAAGIPIAAPNPPELVLNVSGFFNVATNHLGNFNRGDYTIREDVALQRGAQEIHIGGEAVRVTNDLTNTYTMSGQFTFGNALSGSNLSDFLIGDASRFVQGGGEFKNIAGTLWSLYVQDNIRVTAKLRLEAGLRWDPYLPYTEEKGRVVCYAPGEKSAKFPNAPVGMLFGGSNADPNCPSQTGSKTNLGNFAPRVGFAYQIGPGGKTVLRGGAGFYYTPLGTHDTNGLADTAPFGPRIDYSGTINFSNPYSSIGIANPFPAQYGPNLPGPNATFTLPVSIYGTIQRDWRMPQLATWNLTLEHQFSNSLLARLSYSANKGTYLANGALGFREGNPAVYIPGASTTSNTQSRRLNPSFGSVGLFTSDDNSHYQSLRVAIEKRMNHGFSVQGNYTWSKMIDDFGSSGTTNPFNRRFDYGTSNDDVPHVFNFSAIWQIPNAPLHGIANTLVNGWQLSSLATWHSGFPFSVLSGRDNSFSGVGADRANYIGGNASLDSGRSHGQVIAEYFNVAAFAPNTPGTFGNSGKNILRGPRLFNTDLSLLKNFKMTERASLQFRSEFFNVFNNVNFSQPQNSLNSSSVGRITAAGDPRILQFALKLMF